MSAPVLRVGLTLRGPRGGLREVVGFDAVPVLTGQDPGHCQWVRFKTRGFIREEVSAAFARWSTRATVVAEGTGEVAPWL